MVPIKADQGQFRGKRHDLTEQIIGVFFAVYNELGYGFVESVYREAMRLALVQSGLKVGVEVPIHVNFRGSLIGNFRADLVVEDAVLLELKTCESLIRQHEVQTMNYLRATNIVVALLMNVGIEPKFRRLLLDNEKKKSVSSCSIRVKPFQDGGDEWG